MAPRAIATNSELDAFLLNMTSGLGFSAGASDGIGRSAENLSIIGGAMRYSHNSVEGCLCKTTRNRRPAVGWPRACMR